MYFTLFQYYKFKYITVYLLNTKTCYGTYIVFENTNV